MRFVISHDEEGEGWSVWDTKLQRELAWFTGSDAEERAGESAASANRQSVCGSGRLREYLEGMRSRLAQIAQEVYDQWEQGEDGLDEELGRGGICQLIADRISSELEFPTLEGGQDGDEHATVLVTDWISEVYEVDIPYGLYETGGGYKWVKIPDVVFTPDMITIITWDVDILEGRDEE